MTTNIQRYLTADILKGLAVLFMIQVHVIEQFASIEVSKSLIGKIFYFLGGPFCAPVFLAVFGFFLVKTNTSSWNYVKRGILLLIIGILLNIVRSVNLLIAIFQGKYNLDPLFYIFGVDILILAGLSIILIAVFRLISKDNLLLYIAAFLIFVFFNEILTIIPNAQNFYLAFISGNFEHSYFPLFPWFSYVLIGYIFKIIIEKYHNIIKLLKKRLWIIKILLFIVLLIFSRFSFEISNNLSEYYHHHFKFLIWVMGFLLLYTIGVNFLVNIFKNTFVIEYISWIGRNVTLIYIFQWIIIGNIATSLYLTQNIIQSELWVLGIITTSCLLTLLFLKIRVFLKKSKDNLF